MYVKNIFDCFTSLFQVTECMSQDLEYMFQDTEYYSVTWNKEMRRPLDVLQACVQGS